MQNSTLIKVALTAAVAVAGAGFFMASWGSSNNYGMVEVMLAGDVTRWKGKEIKVHGYVIAGSIVEKVVGQETWRTFVLHHGGKKIRIFSKGPKPDTFKDDAEVVATGKFIEAMDMKSVADSLGVPLETDLQYAVEATELSAKCPSKYEGANANKDLNERFSGSAGSAAEVK